MNIGQPKNYRLKSIIDIEKPGVIQTEYKADNCSENQVLACCDLSPNEVSTLVERLYWSDISGEVEYHTSCGEVALLYPFSLFWSIVTDHFAIAQYSNDYGLWFQLGLQKKLQLDDLKYPHFVRIRLAESQQCLVGKLTQIRPHDVHINSFDCRAAIISHATYVHGMLDVITRDFCKRNNLIREKKMSLSQMNKFCKGENIYCQGLYTAVDYLRKLRNESAHEYQIEKPINDDGTLSVNSVSDLLLELMELFVGFCEKRYGLIPAKTDRFYNCFRMLAGELNSLSQLNQHVTIGKTYPDAWNSYFFG